MCVVCKEWQAGKLTSKEALNNLGELINAAGEEGVETMHYWEVTSKILDKEVPVGESDEELDKSWHDEIHGNGD